MASKVYVEGLAWATTTEGLRAAFEECGAIEDCIVIRDRYSGRSRGFGFVTFSNEQEAHLAIERMNNQELDGRPIRLNIAQERRPNDRYGDGGVRREMPEGSYNDGGYHGGAGYNNQGPPAPQGPVNNAKLYVEGLAWATTTQGLHTAFEECGNIEDCIVIRDRVSGRSRGFGFVTFSTDQEAQVAVERMNGQELDGRVIRVNVAQGRRANDRYGQGGGGMGMGGGGGGDNMW